MKDKTKLLCKSLVEAGAATAFAGAVLYGTGKTLSFLFRDVDPDQKEELEEGDVAENEPDADTAETELEGDAAETEQ